MRSLLDTPLEQLLANAWNGIDPAYRRALPFILVITLLAFGFEMTSLTLHHDDVAHIFIQDTILGHYLGRFGFGWLHYYTQDAYIMPFLQLAEAAVLMAGYGFLAWRGRAGGARASLRGLMQFLIVVAVVVATVYLTGLSPSVLVYDAKVLILYLGALGVALIALIALGFMNPLHAIASVLLFLPGWLLIKSSYVKWEAQDQPGF